MHNLYRSTDNTKLIPLRRSLKSILILDKFSYRERNTIKYINYDDILYFEAQSNYTIIHLLDDHSIVICKTLGTVLNSIYDIKFIRCHAKYVVNLKYLRSIDRNKNWKLHIDTIDIPVSRKYYDTVKSIYN